MESWLQRERRLWPLLHVLKLTTPSFLLSLFLGINECDNSFNKHLPSTPFSDALVPPWHKDKYDHLALNELTSRKEGICKLLREKWQIWALLSVVCMADIANQA